MRIILTALAVAVCVPSVGSSQYVPKWHVGDWWVVEVRYPSLTGHGWQWQDERYDVLSKEKVGGGDCFVLQEGSTDSPGSGPRKLYYVRTDSYTVVRMVKYPQRAGRLVGPDTSDFLESTPGPDPGVLLPLFPLDTATVQDSTFRLYCSRIQAAYLRQFSGTADSALIGGYLGDPDTSRGHPVRPRGGRMYSVLCESGVPRDSVTVPYVYSLQLWSTDYPWRLYEERGQYTPPGSSSRQSNYQSWLIASGHAGK